MGDDLARNWWAIALRGALALIFGSLAITWPGLTTVVLAILFGAYAFVDGIFALVTAVKAARCRTQWWPMLLEGIAGIVLGVLAIVMPLALAVALVSLVAAWAIITGVLEIVAAVRLRQEIQGEWLLILSGVLSVICGIAVALVPAGGLVAIGLIFGIYAIIFGISLLGLAFRLRGHQQRMELRTHGGAA